MYVDPTGEAFFVFLIAALVGFAVSTAVSAVTQAAFNGGQVNWGTALIDGLFGAISGALWMVPGLGAMATGLINAGLTAVNGLITTGIENNWQFSAMDIVSIGISAFVSGAVSGATRKQFLKASNFMNSNLSFSRKITDTIIDIGFTIGGAAISMAVGALVGSIGGPVGTILGVIAGGIINIGIWAFQTFAVDLYNSIKVGFHKLITQIIPNAWNNFVNGWKYFWSFAWI